jgi:hypothetical protein
LGSKKLGNAGVIVNEQVTTLGLVGKASIDIPLLAQPTNRKNKREKKKRKD